MISFTLRPFYLLGKKAGHRLTGRETVWTLWRRKMSRTGNRTAIPRSSSSLPSQYIDWTLDVTRSPPYIASSLQHLSNLESNSYTFEQIRRFHQNRYGSHSIAVYCMLNILISCECWTSLCLSRKPLIRFPEELHTPDDWFNFHRVTHYWFSCEHVVHDLCSLQHVTHDLCSCQHVTHDWFNVHLMIHDLLASTLWLMIGLALKIWLMIGVVVKHVTRERFSSHQVIHDWFTVVVSMRPVIGLVLTRWYMIGLAAVMWLVIALSTCVSWFV
jgi:hypothetical protein